jgi:Zn-finger nucleic acid-binding protein
MIALNCPVCHARFKEIVKQGVLIDVCTECRGVWLDRGELDKLLAIADDNSEHQMARWFDDDGYYPEANKKRKT